MTKARCIPRTSHTCVTFSIFISIELENKPVPASTKTKIFMLTIRHFNEVFQTTPTRKTHYVTTHVLKTLMVNRVHKVPNSLIFPSP